jgi:cytochrome d ubiquinol oxidase subunit II
MSALELAWLVMGVGLIAYVLTGGADLGGGIWDLLASGPRKQEQRVALAEALAPIWEANHVWLIFVIVVLFTVFPRGFAAISIALHIPLTLALLGIVLRGSAFVFRAYGLGSERQRLTWGRTFAWASVFTPLFLGMSLAALASGDLRLRAGIVESGFLAGWLTPFAVLVGLFGTVLFTLLAAVYMTLETSGELREDFRRRALWCEGIAAVLAAAAAWRASVDAPLFFTRFLGDEAGRVGLWALQGATAACAIGAVVALWLQRFRTARIAVVAQVTLVLAGWGRAMQGHVLLPGLRIEDAGARPEVLSALFPALGVGALLLGPSLVYLFRVFKTR